jgi:hypothetical protein
MGSLLFYAKRFMLRNCNSKPCMSRHHIVQDALLAEHSSVYPRAGLFIGHRLMSIIYGHLPDAYLLLSGHNG